MMKANLLVLFFGICAAGLANAECPASLDNYEMVKCQDIEKTGVSYQDWLKNQENMAEQSTISPVTGQDVRTVAPAAGAEESEAPAD